MKKERDREEKTKKVGRGLPTFTFVYIRNDD